MASSNDIQKAVADLDGKWSNPPVRDGLFGNVLKSITISNIRGLNLSLELAWPVIAIGGINGSGKTTIIQIASAAYAKQRGGRYYRLGDWIRNALQSETSAIQDPASVSFCFWDKTRSLDIAYQPAATRWGYPKRGNPQRCVEFIGIAAFAPRIERKDRTHVFRTKLIVRDSKDIDCRVSESISKILGCTYDQVKIHTVSVPKGKWEDTLPELKRGNCIYSEPHMGAGEQKIIRLVNGLEALPERSLILLEEPEITLHPDAQRGLAWYLMTLSRRKGHQILIATHSQEIFQTLPIQGRILLVRDRQGIQVLHKVKYLDAARELSSNVRSNKDLILVEDLTAKSLLTELLTRYDRKLKDNTEIIPVGNTDDVHRLVRVFRDQGVNAVGVRDPDIGQNPNEGMFSLPGDLSPEELLLSDKNINAASQFIDGLQDAYTRARACGFGHTGSKWAKHVFEALPHEAGINKAVLVDRLTIAWLSNNASEAQQLAEGVMKAFNEQYE